MHFSPILGGLALASSVFGVDSAPTASSSADSPLQLKPIDVKDFESAFGIQRRAAEQFSSLDLQTQEQLIYGRPGGEGQLILANMTLYAEDGLQIVLMERFDSLTKSVDCKGDDGTMSLTFDSQAAFDYAKKVWGFINQSEEQKFLLIANHEGCGPDDERQPYLITNIREDIPTLTTFLTAQAADWSEVASTYDLDFGHALVPTAGSGNTRRGFGNDLLGNFDDTKSSTFSVAVGTPNQQTSILDTSTVKIDCENYYVAGKFTLTGHIKTHLWRLKELTLAASPSGLNAELELGTTITKSVNPSPLSYSKTLFTVPIPDAGIAISKIFTLGATISYDVGVTASFTGSASVKYGLSASIPDSAKITADLVNHDNSAATGFDGFQVTPLFDVTGLSAGVTLTAYSQPTLSFGIDILKIGKLDAEFPIKLPEVSATLTGGYSAAGFCSSGTTKTGVNLTSTIGVEVDFELDAGFLGDDKNFTKKLWGADKPLFSKCFPLDIPGLGPASSSVSAPSTVALPTSTGIVSVPLTSVGTAVPIQTASGGTAVSFASGSVGTMLPIQTTGPGNGTAPNARRRVRLA